ncbi:hypothetical protein TREAZ_0250 [Leadbettera azotonutricia ZAS-9]|uniref:Uncharacterized protein n=1 Tax=Leadbettera azotonutricia (strain ATCC BAA-888 / DSM 13862 / ZAS-9) TaxID=545695 RepID=F5YE77_LEAAZ|nr:hypothetical protein TREAZ_0250 [Leadbettera azotonutricia ZAS-9]
MLSASAWLTGLYKAVETQEESKTAVISNAINPIRVLVIIGLPS